MPLKRAFLAMFLTACLAHAAQAADQVFDAPDAASGLHAVNGKTYWEIFAMCFASAGAALEKAVTEKNEAQQQQMDALAADVRGRGIARLVADRAVFEGEAEEVVLARAAQAMPEPGFAAACRLYVKDHDSRFGTPN
jgi:GNAT superfamily N-acetyltransferase